MSWFVTALSHRGAVRASNEDGVSLNDRIIGRDTIESEHHTLQAGRHLIMIADGMGGHTAGEHASRIVLEHVSMKKEAMFNESTCIETVSAANDIIYAEMEQNNDLVGMGTTLVGVALSENAILTFNVGDSRCYLHGPHGLIQLSTDDSPPKSTSLSKRKGAHIITQSLGGRALRKSVSPNVIGSPPLLYGERLLLCSDGLTDYVEDYTIAEILEADGDLINCSVVLNDAAMQRGGRDNISIVLVEKQG